MCWRPARFPVNTSRLRQGARTADKVADLKARPSVDHAPTLTILVLYSKVQNFVCNHVVLHRGGGDDAVERDLRGGSVRIAANYACFLHLKFLLFPVVAVLGKKVETLLGFDQRLNACENEQSVALNRGRPISVCVAESSQ